MLMGEYIIVNLTSDSHNWKTNFTMQESSNNPKQIQVHQQLRSTTLDPAAAIVSTAIEEDFRTCVEKSVAGEVGPQVSSLVDGNLLDDHKSTVSSLDNSGQSCNVAGQLESPSDLSTNMPHVSNLWSTPISGEECYTPNFTSLGMNGVLGALGSSTLINTNSGGNGHSAGPSNTGNMSAMNPSVQYNFQQPQVPQSSLFSNQNLAQQFSSSLQVSNNQPSPSSRRAITGQHPIPAVLQHQQRLAATTNPFFSSTKTYPTWSSAPQGQTTWSNPSNPGHLNPWATLQQRRQTPLPNPSAPLGTQLQYQKKMMQSSSIISPSRFKRSTSFPGHGNHQGSLPPKSPYDLATAASDDFRELNYNILGGCHPHQQVCQERLAVDSMRFPALENHLMEIIRGANQSQDSQEQFKVTPRFPYFLAGGKSWTSLVDGDVHGHLLEESAFEQTIPSIHSPTRGLCSPATQHALDRIERYSRKVFVGGLPPDIDEEEITAAFRRFGALVVDWPHKAESKSYFPPKGYCFLLFQDEISVQTLISSCILDDEKLYWCVSSPTMKDKPVQIRPWNLSDSDFVMDGSQPLDPRKTIFVGGVPRPLRAVELAMIMDRLYGGVCYAGIDTDPELKYPKGAGRVAFSNQQSYIAAISARFVQLQHGDIDKRVEVKPYVLDDQMCDECQGTRCAGKFAPFFCANVMCLQYYCEQCWAQVHSRQGREFHKPLVKEGADRPRAVPFRWC